MAVIISLLGTVNTMNICMRQIHLTTTMIDEGYSLTWANMMWKKITKAIGLFTVAKLYKIKVTKDVKHFIRKLKFLLVLLLSELILSIYTCYIIQHPIESNNVFI